MVDNGIRKGACEMKLKRRMIRLLHVIRAIRYTSLQVIIQNSTYYSVFRFRDGSSKKVGTVINSFNHTSCKHGSVLPCLLLLPPNYYIIEPGYSLYYSDV